MVESKNQSCLIGEGSYSAHIPDGFTRLYEPDLFQLPDHLRLQADGDWKSFYLLDQSTLSVVGEIHFYLNDRVAVSPGRAPFASFMLDEAITEEQLDDFIQHAEEQLTSINISSMVLKNPSDCLHPYVVLLEKVLVNRGYRIVTEETSAIIPVDQQLLHQKMSHGKRYHLHQTHKHGLLVDFIGLHELPAIYAFLSRCRSAKGYMLSMSLEDLLSLAEVFPDRILLTVVRSMEHMVAASISVLVSSELLYTLYYDHDAAHDSISPVGLLISELYTWSRQRGIGNIDLGTSNPDGLLKPSLLQFKTELGAVAYPKRTFEKKLQAR